MYRIDVPEKVEHIIDTLTAAGHEAYAVGGCVRDALAGKRTCRLGYYHIRISL